MYQIDNQSREPIYEQIIEQIENYVLKGVLKPGDQIPSVRAMSLQMHLNPNTVQKAYAELDRKKVIYTVSGKGCFVSPEAMKALNDKGRERLIELSNFIKDLALAGIDKKVIIELVEEIYKEEI